MPTTTKHSTPLAALHFLAFLARLPFFLAYAALYLLVLHNVPLPAVLRKASLWTLMSIPFIWWGDLRVDGQARGHVHKSRVPNGRCIIVANYTSPIDALYLATVFDPIFTISYPDTRKVRQVGLLRAIAHALSSTQFEHHPSSAEAEGDSDDDDDGSLTTLSQIISRNPKRTIVVFPEAATTNGKGVLPLTPSILDAPETVPIYPVSIRYTPPEVTTPVTGPAAWPAFLYNLLSQFTICIRVRVADKVFNGTQSNKVNGVGNNGGQSIFGGSERDGGLRNRDVAVVAGGSLSREEQVFLDQMGDTLARLGRSKRVGLTLQDKEAFVAAWKHKR